MARKHTKAATRWWADQPIGDNDFKRRRATRKKPKKKGPQRNSGAPTRKRRQAYASKLQTIDGIAVDFSSSPCRTVIFKADSILMEQGYTEQRDLNGATNKKLSIDLLRDLNCSLVPLGPRYSLVTTQTDKITIDNPYIENPQLKTSNNKIAPATKNFPNECDPFYDLDEAMPHEEKGRRKARNRRNIPDLTLTAATLATMNFTKKAEITLDEFIDEYSKKRSHH